MTWLCSCRNAPSVSGWDWDACHSTIDSLSEWMYVQSCVNFTNFYTQNSTDTKFLFEVTIFYTRKWACDKANGVCGIKLVHFSCSFITPVKWCPAVQCFIILQVVIVRHPVANSSTVLVAMPWWLWAAVCCHVQNSWMETNPLIASQSFIFFRILVTSMYVTVFTHRKDYDRHRNLLFVLETVNRHWGWSLWSTRDMTSCTSTGRYISCWQVHLIWCSMLLWVDNIIWKLILAVLILHIVLP